MEANAIVVCGAGTEGSNCFHTGKKKRSSTGRHPSHQNNTAGRGGAAAREQREELYMESAPISTGVQMKIADCLVTTLPAFIFRFVKDG